MWKVLPILRSQRARASVESPWGLVFPDARERSRAVRLLWGQGQFWSQQAWVSCLCMVFESFALVLGILACMKQAVSSNYTFQHAVLRFHVKLST